MSLPFLTFLIFCTDQFPLLFTNLSCFLQEQYICDSIQFTCYTSNLQHTFHQWVESHYVDLV